MEIKSRKTREEKEFESKIKKKETRHEAEKYRLDGAKAKILLKSKKTLITIAMICLSILVGFIALMQSRKSNNSINADSELLRARNYAQFEDGDEDIEGTDNVKFSAFFLRDLDGDGYAEKLKGTCKEVGKEDILYMEINVQSAGYLKNAKIQIDGKNFYFQTALPKDNELKANYIGNNVKNIEFERLNNGTQKIITGMVHSGDYNYASRIQEAINNNINNYSRQDNTVLLTGVYVSDNGTEVNISKEVNLEMDWYGSVRTELVSSYSGYNYKSQENNIIDAIDEENDVFRLHFKLKTEEMVKNLFLKNTHIEGIVPQLNGFDPVAVNVSGNNVEFNYDNESRVYAADVNATIDDFGNLLNVVSDSHCYNDFEIEIEYPLDAYRTIGSDTVEYQFPVNAYHIAFNNTSEEFTNPIQSNTVSDVIIVNVKNPTGDTAIFETTIGRYAHYPYSRYMVSKDKPLRMYNGISEEEINDVYSVKWSGKVGSDYDGSNIIMKERRNDSLEINSDKFIDNTGNEISMDDISSNVAIYFSNLENVLGKDGWIRVYDDENNYLIETFNKSNWNLYNQYSPYYFDIPYKHLRIETSAANKETELNVYCIKTIDDDILIDRFSKEEFDSLKYIKTTLVGYLNDEYINTDVHQANYEEKLSVLSAEISNSTLSTIKTNENINLYISPVYSENNNEIKWKNGIFLLKFPQEIIDVNMKNVVVNNSNVDILSSEKYEEDGYIFIKIITSNTKEEIYTIDLNLDITSDPRIPTQNKSIEVFGYNELASEYYDSAEDIYDINGNGTTNDSINENYINIRLISPSSLLTSQSITAYDEEQSTTIAPNIAMVSIDKREAIMEVNVTNNYDGTVSDVLVLGRIPFEGNKYVISQNDLNSDFSVNLKEKMTIPESLRNKIKIYYSTNENATNDLNDSSNEWTEEPVDFSQIKSFLIDFQDYRISSGENINFSYSIRIPESVNYNDISYGHHGIYFSLDTPSGKYRTQTEPNKVGIMIARQYNLILNKKKYRSDNNIQGAIYSVETANMPDGRNIITASTDMDGNATFNKLNIEKEYIFREIKSPDEYVLDHDEVRFKARIDTNGELQLDVLNGLFKETPQIINNQEIMVKTEDKSKYDLTINKKDTLGNPIGRVKFRITDENGKEIALRTGMNGVAVALNLEPDVQYYFEEMKVDGYYIDKTRYNFKVLREGDSLRIESDSSCFNNAVISPNGIKDNVSVTIINEKIPTYRLSILKIEKGDNEQNGLAEAKYMITSDDAGEYSVYKTDENGFITIDDMYAYEEGKNIKGTYSLQEVSAPDGYVRNKEIIEFKVVKTNDEFEVQMLNQENTPSVVSSSFENNTLNIVLNDKPTFTLSKQDKDTGAYLKDAKFVIYRIDENNQVLDYAKDSFGNYLGEKDNSGRYIITTDENGIARLPLAGGRYKAIEVEAPDGYVLPENESTRTKIFTIQGQAGDSDVLEINNIECLVAFSRSVNSGVDYQGKKIILTRDLDFNDDSSYNNPADTQYGDINGDGRTTGIKDELTDRNGQGFDPIGYSYYRMFKGTFDGNNYKLDNIYIKRNQQYIGLFGYANSIVQNLELSGYIESTSTSSYSYIGAIVGYGSDTKIINCTNNSTIVTHNGNYSCMYLGGIAGMSKHIEKCSNKGQIIVDGNMDTVYVGGIVGYVTRVVMSYNTGCINVEAKKANVGGIAGRAAAISFIYNKGDINVSINDTSKIGGIGGIVTDSVLSAYNLGNIVANGNNITVSYISTGITNNNSYYNSTINLSEGENQISDTGVYVEREALKDMVDILNGAYSIWKSDIENVNEGYPVIEYGEEIIYSINSIEDLVKVSNIVNRGIHDYKGDEVVLNRTLDFNDDLSYENPNSIYFGDLNEDGVINSIKQELTDEDGAGFNPIGKVFDTSFQGTFDGNNNEIKNIYINRNSGSIGLFGYAIDVKNVHVSGKYIYGENDENAGTIFGIGGIAGHASNGSIVNCSSNVEIICNYNQSLYIGGIVGYGKCIENCWNYGKITDNSTNAYTREIGGICGNLAQFDSIIKNCANMGELTINNNLNAKLGGIVGGLNSFSGEVLIRNCYNTGKLNGKNCVGQITYSRSNANSLNCYYLNTDVFGNSIFSPGISMSILEMETTDFLSLLNVDTLAWCMDADINNGLPLPNNDLNQYSLITEINCIEDLIFFSKLVNCGNTYDNVEVKLMRDLDFLTDDSYRNKNDMSFGDLDGDGTLETIKEELSNINGNGFPIIGDLNTAFKGIFDGNEYAISNLITYSKMKYNGFFAMTDSATIKNLNLSGKMKALIGMTTSGTEYTGGLIGKCTNTTITNCEIGVDINKITGPFDDDYCFRRSGWKC